MKGNKKYMNKRKIAAIGALSGLVVGSGAIALIPQKKVYALVIDGKTTSVETTERTVGKILEDAGIKVSTEDKVSHDLEKKVDNSQEIVVDTARNVTIKTKDGEKVVKTASNEASEVLKDAGLKTDNDDKVLSEKGGNGRITKITVTFVTVKDETKEEEIPFETTYEDDASLEQGKEITEQEGHIGKKTIVETIVYEDDTEKERNKKSEVINTDAKNAIIKRGTKVTQTKPTYGQSNYGGSVRLSNGNTAGATGSEAAQEMARRTGVSASTWETIIARESNGNPNAYNPSGASGLFQTMPGWGSTATVADQIDAATRAYNAQGLGAWGF